MCANSNICSKRNPDNLYGFGFARKAIECLGVLAPEGVEVISGPCFIRCSRGVNARIVLPAKADTVPPPAMKRTRLAWGTGQATPLRSPGLLAAGFQDLFGLNSVEKCAETLREQGVDVPSQLLHAYERYAKAVVVLDESRAGGPSTSARAFEATPLLEVTTEFLLTHEAPPPASWPERLDAAAAAAQAPLIRARSDWANSRWRESFYRSELVVNAPSSPSNGTSESRSSGGDVGTLHGAEMHGAGEYTSRAHLSGTYGLSPGAGKLVEAVEAVERGRSTLRGRWEEETGANGRFEVQMSDDNLRFSGMASTAGQANANFKWDGERLCNADWQERGTARARWAARALALHSGVCLELRRPDEAYELATHAARVCPWLPEVWEALASAAERCGDGHTAALALAELLALEPPEMDGLTQALANKRRLQRIDLERIRKGGLRSLGLAPAQTLRATRWAYRTKLVHSGEAESVSQTDGKRSGTRDKSQGRRAIVEGDAAESETRVLRAVFAEEFSVPDDL